MTKALFDEIYAHLAKKDLLMRAGSIVDDMIIAAPSSTKNAGGEHAHEMRQSKNCNQWHSGTNAHFGVEAESGLVHTASGLAANVNAMTRAVAILHDQETSALGDVGHRGVFKRLRSRPDCFVRCTPAFARRWKRQRSMCSC